MKINKNVKAALIKRNNDNLYVLFHDEKEIKEITNEDFNSDYIYYVLPIDMQPQLLAIFMKVTGLKEKALLEKVKQKSISISIKTEHYLLQCQECGFININKKGLCRHCGIATKKED